MGSCSKKKTLAGKLVKAKLKKKKKKKPSKVWSLVNNNGPGFPGGAVVENPPANAGDMGSSPGLGRSHMLRSN